MDDIDAPSMLFPEGRRADRAGLAGRVRLTGVIVGARTDAEKAGFSFVPIVNHPVDRTI